MLLKRGFTRFVAATMLAIMVSVSVVAPIARAADEDACAAAQSAAQTSTPGALWFFAGCIGGCLGVILAYVIQPNPPASSLVGKSPEYVARYSDCYREAGKKSQTKMAWTGCVIGAVASLAWNIAVVAGSSSTN